MTGRPSNPIKNYISIIYKFKKQTVILFVDNTINELKVKCFTYWFYKDKYYLVLKQNKWYWNICLSFHMINR